MSSPADTIAAIATAAGEGAIAIVRVSGPDSLAVADRVVRCPPPRPSERPDRSFFRGVMSGPSGVGTVEVDEVVVLIFRAPHSYTAEDVVEIQGHGGTVCAQRILHAVVAAGARLAEPGEFTRRAFLNGRIDLTQAEAVIDLIRARSDRASAAALEQLSGTLGRRIEQSASRITDVLARLEARLDFPDEDIPEFRTPALLDNLLALRSELDALLRSYKDGRLLRDGAVVPIVGRPNVGKSSVFNGLLGTARAIVTHIPGTTRDTIEECIIVQGIQLRIVDTAGIRSTGCVIESEGITRSIASMRGADACVLVLDSTEALTEEDQDVMRMLEPTRTVVALNKVDAGGLLKAEDLPGWRCVPCSAITGVGIEILSSTLINLLDIFVIGSSREIAISDRHRLLLQESCQAIDRSVKLLSDREQDQTVLVVTELREGLHALGMVTGREYDEAVLDSIFSRFCIGK